MAKSAPQGDDGAKALERWNSQLRKGVFELLVLGRLERARSYGYALIADLKRDAGMEDIAEGTLYPVLSRLKSDGFVTAEWVAAAEGAPRKYYAITAQGRRALAHMRAAWMRIDDAVRTRSDKE